MIRIAVAAGLITASLANITGVAQAAPGFAYDNGSGNPVQIGDRSATGATAQALSGNKALAGSVIKPAAAAATVVAVRGTGRHVWRLRPTQSPPSWLQWICCGVALQAQ